MLGLERRLEAETRSLLDSLACRFCRIKELAIAAAIAAQRGPEAPGSTAPSGSCSAGMRAGPQGLGGIGQARGGSANICEVAVSENLEPTRLIRVWEVATKSVKIRM